MKTMQELYQSALDVQNACNLSGVLYTFANVVAELRTHLHHEVGTNFSTSMLNTHPIVVLFSNKITSLSNSEDAFASAYNHCCYHASLIKKQESIQTC
jgi:hypothetical protein